MPPAFIDANVFIYAFLKPKRKLQPHEEKIKEAAKKIVTRINDGEETVTSVVHYSEICNILETHLPTQAAHTLEKNLLFTDNIQIKQVTKEHYQKAIATAEDHQIGTNDALAYTLMKERELTTIYSFDKDLDKLKDIQRTTQ